MPPPPVKIGDRVVWMDERVFEVLETPIWNRRARCWESRGKLLFPVEYNLDWKAGDIRQIVFYGSTVEQAGWRWYDTPFERYVRDVLRENV